MVVEEEDALKGTAPNAMADFVSFPAAVAKGDFAVAEFAKVNGGIVEEEAVLLGLCRGAENNEPAPVPVPVLELAPKKGVADLEALLVGIVCVILLTGSLPLGVAAEETAACNFGFSGILISLLNRK